MRITIIGSGNVATHMAAAFKNAGHIIVQVYSPTYKNAALLAYHVGAEATDDLAGIITETDVFVISVKDDAIESIAAQLAPYHKLTVHTSGATGLQTISKYNALSGVIYPLQTFNKVREVDFIQVPLCIEATTADVTIQLQQLAHTVSKNVSLVDSEQRRILHLSAVFACNFPNHLYAIAQQLLVAHNLRFDMLRPLILETAAKVQQSFPADVQTGPAIRNDQKTMATHLKLLDNEPKLKQLYEALSQSIIKMGFTHNGDK